MKFDSLIMLLGSLLSLGGLVVDNIFIIVFGVILVVIYIGVYINSSIFRKIKINEDKLIDFAKDINRSDELSKVIERLAYLEGKMSVKNKKGQLNPIVLIVVLLLLAMVIIWLKQQNII